MSEGDRPAVGRLKLELLAEIAVGATTRVDLCRSIGPYAQGELLAVKRLQPELKNDPVLSKRFLDEVWMTSALRHENVVRVIGWGTDDGGSYLAVELVQGVSLARLMKTVFDTGEDFTERLAVHIGTSIARGLGAAHDLRSDRGESLQLIHRNLTPSNVLCGFQGDVKIADFGLAKAKQRLTSSTASSLPNRLQTHVSPEEVRGETVDHRADLFSLGVILYEMLTRKLPFAGPTDLDTVQKIVREPPPDMLSLRPKLDRNLARTVMRCLEKDPAVRWQSAHDVVRELGAWMFAHGWTEENDVTLGRFVRRNGMRQMNWFERAIAGRAPEPAQRPAPSFPGRIAPSSSSGSTDAPKPRQHEKSRAEVTAVERPLPRRRRADSNPHPAGGAEPSRPGARGPTPARAGRGSDPPQKVFEPILDAPTLFEEDSEEIPTIAMRRSEMPPELLAKIYGKSGENRAAKLAAPAPPDEPAQRHTTQRGHPPPPGGAASSITTAPGPAASVAPPPQVHRSKPPPLPARDSPPRDSPPRAPMASDPQGPSTHAHLPRGASPQPLTQTASGLGGPPPIPAAAALDPSPPAHRSKATGPHAPTPATDWARALDRIRLERETYLTAASSMRESAKQLVAAAEDEEKKARKAEAAIALAKEAQALAATGATQEARARLEEALRMVGAETR